MSSFALVRHRRRQMAYHFGTCMIMHAQKQNFSDLHEQFCRRKKLEGNEYVYYTITKRLFDTMLNLVPY